MRLTLADQHAHVLGMQTPLAHCAKRVVRGCRQHVDLRDLMQDASVALLAALPRYDGREQIVTFAWRRVEGAMIDGLRRWSPHCRQTGAPLVRWEGIPRDAEERWAAPSVDPIAQRFASELHALIGQLPPREAYVIRRRFYEDAPAAVIATELAVSVSWVQQVKRRALQQLRAWLTPPIDRIAA